MRAFAQSRIKPSVTSFIYTTERKITRTKFASTKRMNSNDTDNIATDVVDHCETNSRRTSREGHDLLSRRRRSRSNKNWNVIRTEINQRTHKLTYTQFKGLKCIFSVLDRNQDGQLNATELLLAARAIHQPVTEAELNDLIAQLDVDLSGTLDMDEWCTFVADRITTSALQADMDLFLHVLDESGDGKLSVRNVLHLFQHYDAPVTEADVQSLFETLNTASSQFITIEELALFLNPTGEKVTFMNLLDQVELD